MRSLTLHRPWLWRLLCLACWLGMGLVQWRYWSMQSRLRTGPGFGEL